LYKNNGTAWKILFSTGFFSFCKNGDLIKGIFQEIQDLTAKGSVVFYD